ncbi:unnamed protein product [Ceutorhynchus assimilis]|uniref:Mitochondrial dicarboxylate carrier n=1 Tax=Ceutorhynchus assimilis TaxID=467358 RepID=A0A9P0GMQ9_9CUCU|nr:unnamed protein product [Ceutorhynchus assimilis]
MSDQKQKRLPRWYFGGVSSAVAACVVHPLDLLKVQLQTQQEGKLTLGKLTAHIIKTEGVFALYNGISASLLRQLTYSMTRFGIYEVVKQKYNPDTFAAKVGLAAGAGACGGFVGTPADMVNVRMQNDMKFPKDKRRNYKHAIDGLLRVYKEEGTKRLFSGASTATTRAIFMTVGQLSFYDQIKLSLINSGVFKDNLLTHFLSSLAAGLIATVLTQPVDVIKTRLMNSKPGEYPTVLHCIKFTALLGPLAFYKGITASASRLIPANILLFLTYETLTKNFGHIKEYAT